MNTPEAAEQLQGLRCQNGKCRSVPLELINEEPLVIRIQERPYSVVMRTPGEELAHAAGFCLAEGLLDSSEDLLDLDYCRHLDPNVVDVRLKPERLEKVRDLLERRGFVSQTSCGICGKELLDDLHQIVRPLDRGFELPVDGIFQCLEKLFARQHFYQRTRGTHAALLFDRQLESIAFAEDVGRHNALDKVIGRALLDGSLERAGPVALSSRISFELVQKAARSRLPLLLSKSRPTALAVTMGRGLNMTLACVPEQSELLILCGDERILGLDREAGPGRLSADDPHSMS